MYDEHTVILLTGGLVSHLVSDPLDSLAKEYELCM